MQVRVQLGYDAASNAGEHAAHDAFASTPYGQTSHRGPVQLFAHLHAQPVEESPTTDTACPEQLSADVQTWKQSG